MDGAETGRKLMGSGCVATYRERISARRIMYALVILGIMHVV
jgi:hypothetical protein